MLLKEYLSSSDIAEATRCLRELNVPHFHHEVVYEVCSFIIYHMVCHQGILPHSVPDIFRLFCRHCTILWLHLWKNNMYKHLVVVRYFYLLVCILRTMIVSGHEILSWWPVKASTVWEFSNLPFSVETSPVFSKTNKFNYGFTISSYNAAMPSSLISFKGIFILCSFHACRQGDFALLWWISDSLQATVIVLEDSHERAAEMMTKFLKSLADAVIITPEQFKQVSFAEAYCLFLHSAGKLSNVCQCLCVCSLVFPVFFSDGLLYQFFIHMNNVWICVICSICLRVPWVSRLVCQQR